MVFMSTKQHASMQSKLQSCKQKRTDNQLINRGEGGFVFASVLQHLVAAYSDRIVSVIVGVSSRSVTITHQAL
jgi:hypothetical protein